MRFVSGIASIAVPLGVIGGLNWRDVKPLIEHAFADCHSPSHVRACRCAGSHDACATKRPKAARACSVDSSEVSVHAARLPAHAARSQKLAYFLQESGAPASGT
jgi:hypothetical protein